MSTVITDPVCGDHGEFVAGTCHCSDYWQGAYCTVPPDNVPCAVDTDCGNFGYYGTCGANGLCTCATDPKQYGTRCEYTCEYGSTDPLRVCGGGNSGICSLEYGTCTCVNGWSGKDCSTPPDTPCVRDSDCGYGAQHGTCGLGVCYCDDLYAGDRCEIKLHGAGDICQSNDECQQQTCHDSSCSMTGAKCTVNDDCTKVTCIDKQCSPGIDPTDSEQWATVIETQVGNMIEQMLTPEGIMALGIFELSAYTIEHVIPLLTSELVKATLTAGVTDNLARMMTGEELNVSAETAARLATEGAAEQMTRMTAEVYVDAVVKEVFEKLVGAAGVVMGMVDMLAMVGMILDVADTAGYSAEVNQSYLDLYKTKFYQMFNSDPTLLSVGFSAPSEVKASDTVEYKQLLYSPTSTTAKTQYASDYISAMRVNSNGNTIIPLGATAAQVDLKAAHTATPLNAALWSMSRGNEQVFQLWLQYWWIVVLVMVILLALLVVPLTIYGVRAAKQHSINSAAK